MEIIRYPPDGGWVEKTTTNTKGKVTGEGVEPPTSGFGILHSTTELSSRRLEGFDSRLLLIIVSMSSLVMERRRCLSLARKVTSRSCACWSTRVPTRTRRAIVIRNGVSVGRRYKSRARVITTPLSRCCNAWAPPAILSTIFVLCHVHVRA